MVMCIVKMIRGEEGRNGEREKEREGKGGRD